MGCRTCGGPVQTLAPSGLEILVPFSEASCCETGRRQSSNIYVVKQCGQSIFFVDQANAPTGIYAYIYQVSMFDGCSNRAPRRPLRCLRDDPHLASHQKPSSCKVFALGTSQPRRNNCHVEFHNHAYTGTYSHIPSLEEKFQTQ